MERMFWKGCSIGNCIFIYVLKETARNLNWIMRDQLFSPSRMHVNSFPLNDRYRYMCFLTIILDISTKLYVLVFF